MEKKLRVCAYCRVSTDKNDQLNSLENQKKYFEDYINKHDNWELISVFADEGVTGTSTKKRTEFNRMIKFAKDKKIDYIITKEVSRFSRNTVDALNFTRELKQYNVGVKFINDNIDTLSDEGEFKLTLMSSLAQEESRKISSRVKWGQERQMEKGIVFGNSIYGFFLKNGQLTINPDEAKTVKLMFQKFIDGKGTQTIATELNLEGIKPKRTKEWSSTAILKILRNEKYCGDLLQKKYVTPDFLEHNKIINSEISKQIFIKNHHEAIIPKEEWEEAQKELLRRSPSREIKNKHSNRYWCSGKVFCGICGERFVGFNSTSRNGIPYKAWRCSRNAMHGRLKQNILGEDTGCSNSSVNDKILRHCVNYVIESININKAELLMEMGEEIKNISETDINTDTTDFEKQLSHLNDKKDNAINSMLEGIITKEDLSRITEKYNIEIKHINKRILEINRTKELQDKQINTISVYIDRINQMLDIRNIYENDTVLKSVTEKITVYPDKTLMIKLKCIPFSYKIKYSATGRGDTFKVNINQ